MSRCGLIRVRVRTRNQKRLSANLFKIGAFLKIIDLIFKIVRRVSGIEARALYSQLLEAKAELKDRQLDSAWNVSSKHLVEKSLDMAVFPATRNQFFGEHIAKLSSGIEVGPSYRPTFSKRDG